MPKPYEAAMKRRTPRRPSSARRLILALLATGLTLMSGLVEQGAAAVRFQDAASASVKSGGTASDATRVSQAVIGPIACVNGRAQAVQNFPCQRVDLLAYLPAAALGAPTAIPFGWGPGSAVYPVRVTGLWGWVDSATHRAFALVGRVDGTAFVEVTDPIHPIYLGELPRTKGTYPSAGRDIKVYRNHAFIVATSAGRQQPNAGIQVFDLTQLRNVQNAPVTFRETARYDGFGSKDHIAIDEATGYAYLGTEWSDTLACHVDGLHMMDIRDPLHPVSAGCYFDPQGSRDLGAMQCAVYHGPDPHYRGREICFSPASGSRKLAISDVTDKQAPFTVSLTTYPNSWTPSQGWLSDDHHYFFLSDKADEVLHLGQKTHTMVFDLSDLDDPVLVKEIRGTTSASDISVQVRGAYLYQANSQAGLRVFDVADPMNPREVGFFDTTPGDRNIAGIGAGVWAVYPYFPADKDGVVVAVTSLNEGLFLLRFRPEAP